MAMNSPMAMNSSLAMNSPLAMNSLLAMSSYHTFKCPLAVRQHDNQEKNNF